MPNHVYIAMYQAAIQPRYYIIDAFSNEESAIDCIKRYAEEHCARDKWHEWTESPCEIIVKAYDICNGEKWLYGVDYFRVIKKEIKE